MHNVQNNINASLHRIICLGHLNFGDSNLFRISYFEYRISGLSGLGHCDLPFDLAQGGEPVEPFDIWDLLFGIYHNPSPQ